MDVAGALSEIAGTLRGIAALRDATAQILKPGPSGEDRVGQGGLETVQVGEFVIDIPPERHIDPIAAERILRAVQVATLDVLRESVEQICGALRDLHERLERIEQV